MNESDQDIAKLLTLEPLPGDEPFGLSETEKNLRPDDWAWLFLRMNKKYRLAYAERENDAEDQNIARHLKEVQDICNVKADRDGSCARRFGLGAWLNPAAKSLPILKFHGSWFFPLKRLVSEDPLRTEVGDKPYRHSKHPFSNDADAHPRLLANESMFGYRTRGTVTYPEVQDAFYEASKGSLISVAIDCGVPPDGQIAALATLAEITQKHIRKYGGKTHHHDKLKPPKAMAPCSCDAFAHMKFEISSGRPAGAKEIKEMDDVSVLWRAISIDALGPVVIQIEAFLKILKKEHEAFVHDRLVVKQSLPSSFQSNFRGGDYLKALLVVSELDELTKTSKGYTEPKRIMNEIKKFLTTRNPANNWRDDFEGNIEERHVPRGQELINGGYKWLIHAQQPYSAPLKRAAKRAATRPTFNRNPNQVPRTWD